jgi:hypothetical protein
MKIIGLLLILLFSLSCEQNITPEQNKTKQTFSAPVDTILIDNHYQVFYISSNPKSKSYRKQEKIAATNQEIRNKFNLTFINDLEKKTGTKLRSHANIDIPRKWAQAHKYNGEFFLYSSNSPASKSAFYITDSTIYRVGPNMLTCNLIKSISSNDDGSADIEIRNNSQIIFSSRIEPIPSNKYVYIWKYFDESGDLFHQEFMIPFDNVNELRMIVNDCFQKSCDLEFEFDSK